MAAWKRPSILGNKPVRVTVIDRTNYHLFQPLLYQVATAALSPADIAAPIRAIVTKYREHRGHARRSAVGRRRGANRPHADRELSYDYLVVATGSRHSYFGHGEWEKLAPGLKSLEDAIEIRRRILMAFEFAERTTDRSARRRR